MTEIRLFIQFELPIKLSVERAKELLTNLIERVKIVPLNSTGPAHNSLLMNIYELNYQCFDLLFMPIIIRFTSSDQLFRELFDDKLLFEFMDTYFGHI